MVGPPPAAGPQDRPPRQRRPWHRPPEGVLFLYSAGGGSFGWMYGSLSGSGSTVWPDAGGM